MSKVEFYYFPIKALGEPVRLLLSYGGQEFEDNRVVPEKWPEFKPKTPFGQMPFLVINGKQYAQCTPICRYLGRKYGLAGADLEEDFEIDQNVELVHDLRAKAAQVQYEEDAATKAKRHEKYTREIYPNLLTKLDEIIRKNNGHLALGKLTWGDFIFAGIYEYLKVMLQAPDLDEKFPSLRALEQAVLNLPKVKEYVAKAPKCDY
ncbi:glutathione S-transferase 2 [Plodia interpunctella]|uniref:glutathione S-transferase 2 n=1 Tax=Plodia interpunctella TaxID=58824 RepID=UPI002186DF8F|nr:glutathione S-transferase 2-like [Plodia interpunctella]XP_053611163.1 glutathione S-transferase 2-like [Plodia interpunctella]UQS35835.1 glutathione-S-transferase sigma 2 [Plodia interpunctella]